MGRFIGRVALTPVAMREGDRMYMLTEPFGFHSNIYGGVITVPQGFYTDMASIPRVLQPVIAKDEPIEPAVIHDWLYNWQCDLRVSRRDADLIFLEAMTIAGMGKIKRGLIFHAVRNFGMDSWRKPAVEHS